MEDGMQMKRLKAETRPPIPPPLCFLWYHYPQSTTFWKPGILLTCHRKVNSSLTLAHDAYISHLTASYQ